MWDTAILNGTLVTASDVYHGNIYIKDGRIGAVTSAPLAEESAETIDAQGLDVFPGFIDTHTHCRDGGAPQKDTFHHATRGAAIGGLTMMIEMPNAIPPVSTVENMRAQIENLTSKAHVDFAMWGLCVGELNNEHIMALHEAGVVAFKFFWGYAVKKGTYSLIYNYDPSDPDIVPPLDDGQVYLMFEAVAKTGKMLGIHAENASLIHRLTSRVDVSRYPNEYEALLACRPNVAEESVVQTAISFARAAGMRLHILHASARESVDLVEAAQKRGEAVSMETCPHYLFLTNKDFDRVGTMIKGYPPVRLQEDQDRLWEGLRDGVICNVCSDHAPHTAEEKNDSLFKIPSGMCGVETLAPLMIEAVNDGRITKRQLAAFMSENPAKLYGLYPRKGALQVGADADLTLVDFAKTIAIRKENLQSVSKVTAFDGFTIKGAPVRTMVRGRTVMKDGEIVSGPCGTFIRPVV